MKTPQLIALALIAFCVLLYFVINRTNRNMENEAVNSLGAQQAEKRVRGE
jgi:uncharacterized protein YoxC